MRQEHDVEKDLVTVIYNDNEIVQTKDFRRDGLGEVLSYDSAKELVKFELHGYSQRLKAASANKTTTFFADPEAEEDMGQVEWEIVDVKDSVVLASGTSRPRLKEFVLDLRLGPEEFMMTARQASSRFRFTPQFSVGIAGSSINVSGSGFALMGSNLAENSFSWDWFKVDAPNHAVKLQEAGEIEFDLAKVGEHWEICKTQFLTDVSIRIAKFGEGPPDHSIWWRINIKKGSLIRWPVLIEGKVVAAEG